MPYEDGLAELGLKLQNHLRYRAPSASAVGTSGDGSGRRQCGYRLIPSNYSYLKITCASAPPWHASWYSVPARPHEAGRDGRGRGRSSRSSIHRSGAPCSRLPDDSWRKRCGPSFAQDDKRLPGGPDGRSIAECFEKCIFWVATTFGLRSSLRQQGMKSVIHYPGFRDPAMAGVAPPWATFCRAANYAAPHPYIEEFLTCSLQIKSSADESFIRRCAPLVIMCYNVPIFRMTTMVCRPR